MLTLHTYNAPPSRGIPYRFQHRNPLRRAAVPLLELYTGERLEFEFQRTCSRLQEMQSHEYLARSHRP